MVFLNDDISNYTTKIIVNESAANEDSLKLTEKVDGDWQSTSGISYEGKTISLEIYNSGVEKIGFLTEDNQPMELTDGGVYLCLRLKDTANIGDVIEFSPYGSEETYEAKVAGYFRSLVSACMVMTDA